MHITTVLYSLVVAASYLATLGMFCSTCLVVIKGDCWALAEVCALLSVLMVVTDTKHLCNLSAFCNYDAKSQMKNVTVNLFIY